VRRAAGIDLATIHEAAANIELYIRADGTRIWSLRVAQPVRVNERALPDSIPAPSTDVPFERRN
jgi:hypothetical protein